MKRIYVAEALEAASGRRCRDFSYKAKKSCLGLFSSKKKAERALAMSVADHASPYAADRLLGFFVYEVIPDRTLTARDAWSFVKEKTWSYTPDGRQFSYSPFSTDWEDERYGGTPEDAIRFKAGDYARAYLWGKFVPVKVVCPPYTPDEWNKRFNFRSDASDDSYTVMTADGHDHVSTCSLFPADGEIPGRIKASIEDREKEYLNGESL